MTRLAAWIATWFGCGYAPKGPGTAGAAGAIVCALLAPSYIPWMIAVMFLPSIWAANVYASARGGKDPQEVVVDEVIGQWIALAGATHLSSATPWILAFGLFRLFDIYKPPPVRQLETLPGGVGIVMDDVMAGVYGAVVMRVLGWNNLY